MPAVTVFLDDPDGHSLDYISMLDGEPHPECGWFPFFRVEQAGAMSPGATSTA
jgi:hypothetical protein